TSATVLIYGYIFDEEEKARDFAAWHQETYNRIKRISDQIPEEDKPEVLFNSHELGTKYTAGGSRYDQSLKLAGARNLIDKIVKEDSPFYGKTSVDVEPEWVMEQNPEYIFTSYLNPNSNAGFETEDVSGAAESVQAISNQTEFSELDAIKNGNVYYIDNFLVGGGGLNPIGAAYLGKLLHPEEFEEIKPDELLREYLAFYSTETEPKGVFLYPFLEEQV
ncbi:ABC transporter substrate-binding protein, partial [Methanothrix soehngenii]